MPEHLQEADHSWEYMGYEPDRERLREALCTLGNGYMATRGAAPECGAGTVHYPGTYAAGCYNRLTSTVAGRQVENEDMANLPNWLPLRFRMYSPHGDTSWLTPDSEALREHRQRLDLRTGVLERTLTYETDGRVLAVRQLRLVHMGEPHLAALRTEFTARGGRSGDIEVEAAIDGSVTNAGVPRYQQLNGRHLIHVNAGSDTPDILWLRRRTSTSDKIVALYTSHDPAISDPIHAAIDAVGRAPAFVDLLESHAAAWSQLWLDPVPSPKFTEYGFSIRYQGHWGVQVRVRPLELELVVPPSDLPPIEVRLQDQAVSAAPGAAAVLTLPEP